MSSSLSVRPLTEADAQTDQRLRLEAFGMPAKPRTDPPTVALPGGTAYGVFDGDRLVGRLTERAYDSWFGGEELPTSGIASVAVDLEHRGRAVLTPLFQTALAAARERGAVISTLFPTAPRIYRRFGYELVSDYATVQVATSVLAAVEPPDAATTRRAELSDVDEVHRIYDTWAAAQNGPLTRRGPSFTASDADFLASFTGVTLALDADDTVVGFASWDRGRGYGEGAVLEVSDLLALTGDGYRALLRALGSFVSVTPQTKIDTSGADPVALFLPSGRWQVERPDPYMLAVLDVPGALAGRRWLESLRVEVAFSVTGSFDGWLDGGYRLAVGDGRAACEPAAAAGPVLSPRGLALLYAGAQSCANLRFAGLLSGDSRYDTVLDLIFGGRQFHIRDYF